jgi:MraZ protein
MLFFSRYHNKIDKKGRISVPASFRGVLAKQDFNGLIAYASLKNPCIEACGLQRFQKMNDMIERMDPFSEERDALANTLFGESMQLAFDSEGRVSLPEHLMKLANIGEDALFIGKGETFEIWEPKAYAAYAKQSRSVVKQQFRHLMKPEKGT